MIMLMQHQKNISSIVPSLINAAEPSDLEQTTRAKKVNQQK